MLFEMSHEDERRWVKVLAQLEENRIETLGVGLVKRIKCGTLYDSPGAIQPAPAAQLLAVA